MLIWLNRPKAFYNRFVFLDRDGILNVDRPDYVKSRAQLDIYPDALEGMRWLKEQAIHPVLISNQSGLKRGLIDPMEFWEIHRYLVDAIERNGGELLAAFYCPHHPDDACSCRKPAPGMLRQASQCFGVDLKVVHFIGDKPTDLGAATHAGCRGVLVERLDAPPSQGRPGSGHPLPPGQTRRFTSLLEALQALEHQQSLSCA